MSERVFHKDEIVLPRSGCRDEFAKDRFWSHVLGQWNTACPRSHGPGGWDDELGSEEFLLSIHD